MTHGIADALLASTVGLVFWAIQRLVGSFLDKIKELETRTLDLADRVHILETEKRLAARGANSGN
jgi:hypothetical protein